MRELRVARFRQLALDLGDGGGAADRWDRLPEQARAQVLALLATMIARGVVDDGPGPAPSPSGGTGPGRG